MQIKTYIQIIMGFSCFGIWSFMAYMNPELQGDYLKFVISVVLGLSALALRDMPPPAKKEPDAPVIETKQEPQQ
jgi:hypothetical protein